MTRLELIDYLKTVNLKEVKVEVSGKTLDIDFLEMKDNTVLIRTKYEKYIVTDSDLVGDLKGLCTSIVQEMMDNQLEQGNRPSIEVFQVNATANKKQGGFDWGLTKMGDEYWYDMLMK